MTACSSCGVSGQPDGARFCFACGSALEPARCGTCHEPMVAGARFCSACGAVGAEAPAPAQPVASRRITSVLFGDLVGFTSLSESRDQEEVRELLTRYFEECRQIIARYGGTVEKFIGDAVMAVWGVPTAHEDDAERAVRAGLELVNTIAALGSDLAIPDLAMRVGIVTGEVAVTIGAQHQGMVAGDAVNTASRVQSVAEPGQVWVDETTRLLTSSAISYVDVGSHAMKGKAEPMPLWSVRAVVAAIGGAQRADGLESPHVGRDRELRLVKEIFHGVEETRRPALLVVDGEPGVGKSRLGWEFEKYADGLSTTVRWHSGRCLSYGEGVAFFALAEAIRSRLQNLRPDDTDDEDESALLELGLEHYVPDADERAWLGPRLGALLGVAAVGAFPREDLFAAWATFLHRVSEDEYTVVLVIDDAQHADDGLLMFLEYLLGVGSFPCFVTLFTRPGLLEEHPSLATNRRASVLHLEALSAPDMGSLLDGLVVGLPPDVRDSLVRRAEGIPLFAVETVRSLIDRDLVIPRGGQYVLADPDRLDLDAVGAPASLQALITARLDTLPRAQRRLIDQGSVIGTTFTRDAIAHLCPDVADLDAELAALVRVQLLRQESNRFSNEVGQYQFVQSVVRQIAYGTLSRRDRKASHLAVVSLLESDEEAPAELASVIAQHYLEALDAVADDSDRDELASAAVAQLRRAAARTGSLGAPGEAAGHLATALERCADPELAAVLEVDLAEQLIRAGDYQRGIQHAERARDALDGYGETNLAAKAVAVLGLGLIGIGDYEHAFAIAEERRSSTDQLTPAVQLELIRAMIGSRLRMGGDIRDLSEDSARLAEKLGEPIEIASSYVGLALHYMTRGPHGLGRMLLEAAAGIAREAHDTLILCRALTNLNADWTQEDARRAAEVGREAVEAARSTGERYWLSSTTLNVVLAVGIEGGWDEALERSEGDAVDEIDRQMSDLVRGRILLARGEPWTRVVVPARDADEDVARLTFGLIGAALDDAHHGRPTDLGAVVAGMHEMFALSGLFDDFSTVFQAASEVALQVGDRAALDAMLALVDTDHRNKPPRGLAAQANRLRGVLAIEDGADPATIESYLRTAIAEAEAWHSDPTVGRCLADLGVWLTRQGRADQAAPVLERARAIYAGLGAVVWAAELDAALAGVTA